MANNGFGHGDDGDYKEGGRDPANPACSASFYSVQNDNHWQGCSYGASEGEGAGGREEEEEERELLGSEEG